jgi:hypothetical protein
MNNRCERCGGELTEMPTNHYAKKIKVCERCRKEDLKRLLNIPDESTAYGKDCPSGRCEW